jgi:phage shock protein E
MLFLAGDQEHRFFERNTMRLKMLVIAMAVALFCSAATPLSQDTLKEYLAKGAPFDFILIDVRGVSEIAEAIGNDECTPYNLVWPDQFQQEAGRIPKDKNIIVYCRSGARTASAVDYLTSNGYTNVYNAGGFMTWTGPTIPPSKMKPVSHLPELSMRAKKS